MSATKKLYKVAPGQRIYSILYKKDFGEGETIDLSHASPADVSALLTMRVIVEIETEVKDGKVSISKNHSAG